MIVVDSSVWIDFFGPRPTRQSEWLDTILSTERIIVGDLMLTEVLQGCNTDAEFNQLRAELLSFTILEMVDETVAIEAARNYRILRGKGITVRKTIDTLIATRCILDNLPLLYSDRDFDPFVEHLGLVSALDLPGVN